MWKPYRLVPQTNKTIQVTRASPRARSAGRLYCTVFLVCFCSQGENTVFFVFLNPIFVVLPPREFLWFYHLGR